MIRVRLVISLQRESASKPDSVSELDPKKYFLDEVKL